MIARVIRYALIHECLSSSVRNGTHRLFEKCLADSLYGRLGPLPFRPDLFIWLQTRLDWPLQ